MPSLSSSKFVKSINGYIQSAYGTVRNASGFSSAELKGYRDFKKMQTSLNKSGSEIRSGMVNRWKNRNPNAAKAVGTSASGAFIGGAYGAISDDTSILGGATMGAIGAPAIRYGAPKADRYLRGKSTKYTGVSDKATGYYNDASSKFSGWMGWNK